MSKVSFYLLKQGQAAERYVFACRLCEKISAQKMKIYLHTDTPEQASYLDDLLWSFRPDTFLPHCLLDTEIDEKVSILIGHGESGHENPEKDFDVLVNLSETVPTFYRQFDRVAEIISADETEKAQGRQRWSQYKEDGVELETHQA
jgi:DNA polymerase-3 subunit chi